MFLSAVWTLILTAPIHCRASIGEEAVERYISPNLFWWRNKLIYILGGLRLCTFSAKFHFWVNYSSKTAHFLLASGHRLGDQPGMNREERKTDTWTRITHTHTHTHTHTPTHTHTHTHTHNTCWFLWLRGLSIGRNGFYTVQAVCAIALHLNLALTGDGAFLFPSKKLTLYDL